MTAAPDAGNTGGAGGREATPDLAAAAARLDAANPLAHLRDLFLLPAGVVYLDGNSLGALPAGVPEAVSRTVREEWGGSLISSWWTPREWAPGGWWTAPAGVGDRIGRLVGAAPGQVLVTDSTSVDLFTTASAALGLAAAVDPARTLLVTDAAGFPTDRYILRSLCRQRGTRYLEAPVEGIADALGAAGPETGVLVLSHVDFTTGRLHDLPALTALAHASGALAMWDLSHSAGVLPLALDGDGVDLAVGCGYKWLNGGPGAPAWLYIARRHLAAGPENPIPGWTSAAEPFAMAAAHVPAAGIDRLRIGTPPILSLRALDAALDVFDDVDLRVAREVSLSLTGFFRDCLAAVAPQLAVATPSAPARRGSQVSVRVPEAPEVVDRLRTAGVLADARPPDIARFGFSPLYSTHADALAAATALAAVTEHSA